MPSGRPISVIVIYTIVGSLFVPFLAATLLYLNNRVKWTEPVPHNAWYTNLLLTAILLLFAIVGAQEVIGALRLGTPLERLAAIEVMRRVVYGRTATHGRLQRVFEITQREPR